MNITLAFDVYGTLIDTHGIVPKLHKIVGNSAEKFSRTWRDKQLEYSFRRGLMQEYKTFAVCTSHALDYACIYYNTSLTNEQKDDLLGVYRILPTFNDVKEGLTQLKATGFRMYAFSNGCADDVENLLVATGIRGYFLGVVSVDEIKSFKPDPAVYRYFLEKSGVTSSNAWLISSNPFDVIGSISVGFKSVWVRRSRDATFDPWGIEPTIITKSLCSLSDYILATINKKGVMIRSGV